MKFRKGKLYKLKETAPLKEKNCNMIVLCTDVEETEVFQGVCVVSDNGHFAMYVDCWTAQSFIEYTGEITLKNE